MDPTITDAINAFKYHAQTIIDTNDTDDLAAWEAYVVALDYMLLTDPYAVLPNRPPQYMDNR